MLVVQLLEKKTDIYVYDVDKFKREFILGVLKDWVQVVVLI